MSQLSAKNREKSAFIFQRCHFKVTPKQNISLFFVETHLVIVDKLREAIDTIL